MQQYHPDASNQFKSLDDIWYYGGQDEHQQEAIFPHEALHHGEVRDIRDILLVTAVLVKYSSDGTNAGDWGLCHHQSEMSKTYSRHLSFRSS